MWPAKARAAKPSAVRAQRGRRRRGRRQRRRALYRVPSTRRRSTYEARTARPTLLTPFRHRAAAAATGVAAAAACNGGVLPPTPLPPALRPTNTGAAGRTGRAQRGRDQRGRLHAAVAACNCDCGGGSAPAGRVEQRGTRGPRLEGGFACVGGGVDACLGACRRGEAHLVLFDKCRTHETAPEGGVAMVPS